MPRKDVMEGCHGRMKRKEVCNGRMIEKDVTEGCLQRKDDREGCNGRMHVTEGNGAIAWMYYLPIQYIALTVLSISQF